MSDVEKRFHETWLGMVQPIEGLVVSVPVLVEAECMQRLAPAEQAKLLELAPPRESGDDDTLRAIADMGRFLRELLDWTPELVDAGEAVPKELELWVVEGRQVVRPTMAVRKAEGAIGHMLLVWDLADPAVAGDEGIGMALDRPESRTGDWEYPPAAKFDRLLRHCRVPVGLLTNREVLRLVYAPHGESSGHIDFRLADMASVGGRPILEAFVMLLHVRRLAGVAPEKRLPALLSESRKRQANVTSDLAEQVFDALQILLRGFEGAAERDGRRLLDDALARDDDHVYRGLLTVMLRLVFVLYAEDRGLLPVDTRLYAEHMSLLGLYERLQRDHGAHPDTMSRRFGAWGHLLALFRAIFLGVEHGDLAMPPRRGSLFDPHLYPFLEGWGPAGGAPIKIAADRAAVNVPTVDDETVFRVLENLVIFEGQRLSYRTLDVEQIGSVYEALMGYHVRAVPATAVCLRPNGVWVTSAEILDVTSARRVAWLKETVGLSKAEATRLADAVSVTQDGVAVVEAMAAFTAGGRHRDRSLAIAKPGQLVLQPGAERRRTSSHYTPRSLSAPIVKTTLDPLLAAMGEEFPSSLLLELKICDPAMGSGAFLVEACRYLGDVLVEAWRREGKLTELLATGEDPVLRARRLVAQRCLYGVDRNEAAVELAKLSLWLVTLARDLPFTFLDHALRHGDSLVGLDFEQIRSFHWKPWEQLELSRAVLKEALDEAIEIRRAILELAGDPTPAAQREKERLVRDAQDASSRARLIADVVVGAFFAGKSDKEREKERTRRMRLVESWLDGDEEARAELEGIQTEIRERIPVFHWMLELPEVFYAERPDPLEAGQVNRVAFLDGFIGNPPFAGKNVISDSNPEGYLDWLMMSWPEVKGRPNTDLCAYFFRRAAALLGSHGALGFVSTNSIAQGDSRLVALKKLIDDGAIIYRAIPSMEWPGDAAVHVAIVNMALGRPRSTVASAELDGEDVACIDSRLRPRPERPELQILQGNANIAFLGGKLVGIGLAVSSQQRDELVQTDPRNADVLRPFLGGEEVNQSTGSGYERFMIDFSDMTLDQAAAWPSLLHTVETLVKPVRMTDKRGTYKTYWWRPGESGGAMYRALHGLPRCLVSAAVTKHLMLSFRPTTPFFSQTLYVFALSTWSAFGALQSRVHEPWARLLSSSMKSDLRYSASECFDTFPFPHRDPRTVVPGLEVPGQRLDDARAAYLVEARLSLTDTYNRLKAPANQDAPILHLRRLHEEMDAAVLAAYGWSDIDVPPYERTVESFQDEVIDRLFLLNAERAEEENKRPSATPAKAPKSAKPRKPAKPSSKKAAQAGLDFEA